jgi:hypothetical protein
MPAKADAKPDIQLLRLDRRERVARREDSSTIAQETTGDAMAPDRST